MDEDIRKDEYIEEESDDRRYDGDRNFDKDSKSGYKTSRGGGGGKAFFKKKVCRFCTQKVVADYKNPDFLRRFITERGKILPRRITGTCAKHQRSLTREIKRSRVLGMLPYVKR